jgi:hypothetical protein
MTQSHRWRYPNLTLLFISLITAYLLYRAGWLHAAVERLGSFEVVGIFIAGALSVSTFTIAPAVVVLMAFAQDYDPLIVALVGGAGAAVGDYLVMSYIRERLLEEINPFLKMLHIYRRVNILHSKHFVWFAPALGAAIIASPFPDELGLALLGASKVSRLKLITLIFILDAVGIFLIALAARQ